MVYELLSCPGFIFIVNPFTNGAQHYWTKRCIEDFTRKPNVSNLDAHMTIKNDESVWELSGNGQDQDLMSRLRWVHLGYHFDYNVVDYKPGRYYGFPRDLSGLMQHIAEAIGYQGYTPEAGIVNYYPIGASMGGHTDHYELDLSWPLISISFGQPAVFLIGGKTKDIKPTAMFIHSGDIAIMSGESRVAFHAVPRIFKVGKDNEPPDCLKWIDPEEKSRNSRDGENNLGDQDKETEDKHSSGKSYKSSHFNEKASVLTNKTEEEKTDFFCQIDEKLTNVLSSVSKEEWSPFARYLSKTRINVNVRQVHTLDKIVKQA